MEDFEFIENYSVIESSEAPENDSKESHKSSGLAKKRAAPKVSGEWNDGDVEQLIAQIEMYNSLWDVTSTENTNKDRRVTAWKAVADSFGGRYTIKQCGIKWQVLRSGLRQEVFKLKSKTSGQAATALPRWKHFSSISFLTHAACESISESNCPPFEGEAVEFTNGNGSSLHEIGQNNRTQPSASSNSSSGINPSGIAVRKRKPLSTVGNESSSKLEKAKATQLLETVAAKFAAPSIPADEWKEFGDYVAAELRSLPFVKRKLLSRKISRCMLDFMDENCPNSSQVPSMLTEMQTESPD